MLQNNFFKIWCWKTAADLVKVWLVQCLRSVNLMIFFMLALSLAWFTSLWLLPYFITIFYEVEKKNNIYICSMASF